jgi:translation elongation factor EF-Ts
MAQVAARVGVQLSVSGFARLQAGEGIERAEKDFAAEVAEVSGVGARR